MARLAFMSRAWVNGNRSRVSDAHCTHPSGYRRSFFFRAFGSSESPIRTCTPTFEQQRNEILEMTTQDLCFARQHSLQTLEDGKLLLVDPSPRECEVLVADLQRCRPRRRHLVQQRLRQALREDGIAATQIPSASHGGLTCAARGITAARLPRHKAPSCGTDCRVMRACSMARSAASYACDAGCGRGFGPPDPQAWRRLTEVDPARDVDEVRQWVVPHLEPVQRGLPQQRGPFDISNEALRKSPPAPLAGTGS